MNRLLEQLIWLAICIYHEARGESVEGQMCVAHAIMNRVNKRDLPIKRIVLQPWQFSWANTHTVQGQPFPPIKDYPSLITCMSSAMECLTERLEGYDFKGADHYYNDKLVSPKWAKKMIYIAQIGNHVFLKE